MERREIQLLFLYTAGIIIETEAAMLSLSQQKILLGITGGIAAYKAAHLVRLLTKMGATVQVVMTQGAQEFITPLTLQALSGHPVHTELLDTEAEAGMGHIELAKWADLILVAPASANFIARLAAGLGNDLLSTLCLASDAPIALAPAMNQAMWRDEITQANIARLLKYKGHKLTLLGPASGEQACGDTGFGRMQEPEDIVAGLLAQTSTQLLTGKKVLITAGPTREAIDPVRYISNHSSGKMGFALAQAAQRAGAEVVLVAGPVVLPTPAGVQRVDVKSAEDMLAACLQYQASDIFIATAAVADFRCVAIAEHKVKKQVDTNELCLTLIKNTDILATLANLPKAPFCVGFAAETQNVEAYALDKLERKKLAMIVANDVSNPAIGFNSEQNAATVYWQGGQHVIAQTSKQHMAQQLITLISEQFAQQNG